jgi:hypothetical protein
MDAMLVQQEVVLRRYMLLCLVLEEATDRHKGNDTSGSVRHDTLLCISSDGQISEASVQFIKS